MKSEKTILIKVLVDVEISQFEIKIAFFDEQTPPSLGDPNEKVTKKVGHDGKTINRR